MLILREAVILRIDQQRLQSIKHGKLSFKTK